MIPSTKASLLKRLSDLSELYKAWRVVRRSALNSKSQKIVNLAKEYDHDSTSHLRALESSLLEDTFFFKGIYGRLEIRPGKTPRPLGIAPIESRIVQRALLNILWENPNIKRLVLHDGAKFSFGGIQEESTKKAISELCRCLDKGYNYYISSDIKNFFQSIPRKIVHKQITSCLSDSSINHILDRALQCELINAGSKSIQKYMDLFPKDDIGVVQGCCLSPLYGNIYLSSFDNIMNSISNIRCLRYIDDFIILGKREHQVKRTFSRAVNYLNAKGLDVYKLNEQETKAIFGDVRKRPIEFLGCSVIKGQVRPRLKARINILKKIDECIIKSLRKIESTKGSIYIEENYLNTLYIINNIIKGWGGSFSFCNDRVFFTNLDHDVMQRIFQYHIKYQKISQNLQKIDSRQRIFGLQMLVDCTDKDPIYKKH